MFPHASDYAIVCRSVRCPASIQRIHATVRAAFNAAVRTGLIAVSPVRGVELPPARPTRAVVWTQERVAAWRRDGIRPVVAVWTTAQTVTFLRTIREHRGRVHGGTARHPALTIPSPAPTAGSPPPTVGGHTDHRHAKSPRTTPPSHPDKIRTQTISVPW
jgi:hypothetical protein